MFKRRSVTLTIVSFSVVEEIDDNAAEQPPTLPPFPVVETTVEPVVSEAPRPLAKAKRSNVVPLRKVAG